MLIVSKKNNNWQELEREEKHYKDDRSSKGDRVKRPYKRDKRRVEWEDVGEDEGENFYGSFYDESD